ncbi:DYNLL [Mytilus coruscus]|uniref:Dynein light chain n=1 Tax=Mytilus coruscus TaxID=42192 RepID=A0A6J8D5N0_MYTCO|nr:DYNLL [Mytilus coruscus]
MSERKAVIKNADMSEDMQQDAVESSSQALEKYNIEKDIAAYIKKDFDKKYNPTWHCVVGRNFGSYLKHSVLTKIRFATSLGNLNLKSVDNSFVVQHIFIKYVAINSISLNLYPCSGNQKIHTMTKQGTYVSDFNGNKAYARYAPFSVGDASTNYKLTIAGNASEL